jgi:hypothetical protein
MLDAGATNFGLLQQEPQQRNKRITKVRQQARTYRGLLVLPPVTPLFRPGHTPFVL